jgi:uncharacterized protein YraI
MILAGLAFPAAASAATARVTADLNMRAGPSTGFPVVTTVNDGAEVGVHGCVKGYSWCDVTWAGNRGWVYAAYLTYPYHDRYVPIVEYGDEIDLPIIAFSVGTYWDDYYRGRPWYHRRDHWRSVWHGHHHHHRHHVRHRSHHRAAHHRHHRRHAVHRSHHRRHGVTHHRRHRHGRHHIRRHGHHHARHHAHHRRSHHAGHRRHGGHHGHHVRRRHH